MKNGKPLEKIKAFYVRLRIRLDGLFLKSPRAKREVSHEKAQDCRLKVHNLIAYNLIGNKTAWVLPLFKDLDVKLHRSGLKVNFKAYVSLTIFATALICTTTFALIPCLLFLVFNLPLLPAVLFGVGGSLFAFAFSTLGFYRLSDLSRGHTQKRIGR